MALIAAKRDETQFVKFLRDRKLLIADHSSVSRAAMAQCLSTIGVKTSSMILAPSFELADEEIVRHKPSVVICDYDLGKRCGLDLLPKQRMQVKDSRDSLFVLVTGNTSQTAVAKAAEEDVDTYVLKPFTPAVFKASILKAAQLKLAPPPYLAKIEEGKTALAEGKLDAALEIFEKAKELDSSPSLACFYLGQTRFIKQTLDGAMTNYSQGLEYNKIHYKCLVGLYEVLMSQKQHFQAYEVISKLSRYFPANPQRLTAVLRLAIMTKSYEDVERYYRVFTNIDERSEEIIKYICAALVVCGKYYLKESHSARALELFQKAAVTASGRTKVLREIIMALMEANLPKQADEYLRRFPSDTRNSADYLTMDLLITDKIKTRSMVIEHGRAMIANGVHDPLAYQLLIQRSFEAGLGASAEELVKSACERWPDQRTSFQALVPQTKPETETETKTD